MSEFASFARKSTQAQQMREKYLKREADRTETPAAAVEPEQAQVEQPPAVSEPVKAAARKRARPAAEAAAKPQAPAVADPAVSPEPARGSAGGDGESERRRNTTFALPGSLVVRIDKHAGDVAAGVLVVLAVQWAYSEGVLAEVYGPPVTLPQDSLFEPLAPTKRRVRRGEPAVVWNARLRPGDFTTLDQLTTRLGAPNRTDLVCQALDAYLHHLEHDN